MNKAHIYRQRRTAHSMPLQPKYRFLIRYLVSVAVILTVIVVAAAFARADSDERQPLPDGIATSLLKVEIPDETPEIIAEYTGFKVSFNPSRHLPNYVAWELTGTETEGDEPRRSRFAVDNNVLGCATLDDYRNSGFDRGHMAPAADMKWNTQAMADCHFLTNICPQDHGLNGGRWNALEQACRRWAKRDSAIIIIAGPVLSDRMTRSIGRSHVSVPERFFKVIFAPYVDQPRAIAFVMPNSNTREPLESMAMSVDQLEEIIGFDFFSTLPDSLENDIERHFNYHKWTAR